ncbi:hypothetical protein Tco_1401539 [Tanacetum coccineum]
MIIRGQLMLLGLGKIEKPKRVKDAAYHKEKMLLCKQEEAGVQLNAEQADWKDDTDDESDDQELEAHYMYMAQLQEVTPDPVDNSGQSLMMSQCIRPRMLTLSLLLVESCELSHETSKLLEKPTAFKSERPKFSKQWFASQVDVNNDLSKPVTTYYLPKERESAVAKPQHMIAPGSSRYSSNDMVHNHYLKEAKKKIQERDRNSKTSMMPSARFPSTTDDSKPKPRNNNQTPRSLLVSKSSCITITVVPKADHSKSYSSFSDSKNFVCSTCQKCVFSANHDACIIKLLKEVNSRAKIQSHKTRNSNKPIDQKSHTQKPGRQIFTRHRFSPSKTSVVYEKTSPRSDLRWKPMGRIFKYIGLRWIPTGKLFDSCTSKVDSEPTHGLNVDIPNIHESK